MCDFDSSLTRELGYLFEQRTSLNEAISARLILIEREIKRLVDSIGQMPDYESAKGTLDCFEQIHMGLANAKFYRFEECDTTPYLEFFYEVTDRLDLETTRVAIFSSIKNDEFTPESYKYNAVGWRVK